MFARALFMASLFLLAAPAWACTCSDAPPGACAGLQKDDVVFLGVVTGVETLPPAAPASSSGAAATGATPIVRYHFRIEQKFAGPDAPEIDVFSGGDDGDCGYRFQKGQQYVVFTHQDTEDRLFATICNGTRRRARRARFFRSCARCAMASASLPYSECCAAPTRRSLRRQMIPMSRSQMSP